MAENWDKFELHLHWRAQAWEKKEHFHLTYYSGASYLFELRKNVSSRKHVSWCLQPSSHYCESTSSHHTLCHLFPKKYTKQLLNDIGNVGFLCFSCWYIWITNTNWCRKGKTKMWYFEASKLTYQATGCNKTHKFILLLTSYPVNKKIITQKRHKNSAGSFSVNVTFN